MQRSNTVKPPVVRATHLLPPGTPSRRGISPLVLALASVIAFLLLNAGLLAWYNLTHEGRVYGGVRVLGVSLGGLTREEAGEALVQVAVVQRYPSNTITVQGGGHTWSFAPDDLGVALDVERTLDTAFSVGRDGTILSNLGSQVSSALGSADVAPLLKSDPALLDQAVANVASDLDKPAISSKLERGADGSVHITPSEAGLRVDREALRADLSRVAVSDAPTTLQVVTKVENPAVTEADLQSAKDQALLRTEQPVALRLGERTWTIEPAQLREMLSIEHEGAEARALLSPDKVAAFLAPIAEEVSLEPQDAAIVMGRGTVELKAEEAGRLLETEAAIEAVQQAAANPTERAVDLPTREVPAAVRASDLRPVFDKVSALVANGVRVRYGDDTYIMRSSSVTGFVSVQPAQGGPGQMVIAVDEDALAERISGIATSYVNRQPADARFRMVNGAPVKVAAAQAGAKVDVGASVDSVVAALNSYSGNGTLEADLVVQTTEPGIKDADISAINTPDMLAFGQTSYATSSANRKANVELGARKIDGTLVPPGAVFSTVDTVGPLTLDAGFKMGFAIVGNGKGGLTTVPAEAGGICQVSTTLFHAVFRGGLKIEERNWHSYWINLYGVAPTGLQGLDATIAPPYKDFRFSNNTGNWLLIKAIPDGKNLTFQLWGVNPGWKVSIGKPVITNRRPTDPKKIVEYSDALPPGSGEVMVEHAADGFDSSISRVVTDGAGTVIDRWTAKSSYQPAYNRYLRPKK